MKYFYLSILCVVFTISCNKEPGVGGTSTIQGQLYRIDTNALGVVLAEYYAADREVYILYGDNDQIYDDDFNTSYDGSFEFTNLVKGTYTIFAYSSCITCIGGQDTIVTKTVEITENKQVVNIGDLIVYK